MSLFRSRRTGPTGLTRDLQGRLLACEHDSRRVTPAGARRSLTVIANSFQGRRLNRPNDVVVKSDGGIYFTDPWTNPLPQEEWDLTFAGVYRLTPDLGTFTLLIDDFVLPNGLAFSPDEQILYINDTRRRHIRAFDLLPNGTLAKQTDPGLRRPLGRRAWRPRRHEGGRGGQRLLRAPAASDPGPARQEARPHRPRRAGHDQRRFGGDDWQTLYFTSRNHLGSVRVKIPGIPVPVGKR